jgi:hypothetical protein
MENCDVRKKISSKVEITESGCWNWMAARTKRGYGLIKVDGKMYRAHRVSFRAFVGDFPSEMFICHHCDNPSCVNPEHLFVGTASDNVQDCKAKGRLNRATGTSHGSYTHPERMARGLKNWAHSHPGANGGEKNGQAKLDQSTVNSIRSDYLKNSTRGSIASLSRKYGISRAQISNIVNCRSWKKEGTCSDVHA